MVTANRPCIPTSVAGCSVACTLLTQKPLIHNEPHLHTVQQVQDTLLLCENDNYFWKNSRFEYKLKHITVLENANLKALKSGGTEIYTHV